MDESLRSLEREFKSTQDFSTGIRLLKIYLREGDARLVGLLLPWCETQYRQIYAHHELNDPSTETILIQANYALGREPTDLIIRDPEEDPPTSFWRYSPLLAWDIYFNKPFNYTQGLIDSINQELLARQWVANLPRLYDDSEATWRNILEPVYAVYLGLNPATNAHFLRISWANIFIPEIIQDHANHKVPKKHVQDYLKEYFLMPYDSQRLIMEEERLRNGEVRDHMFIGQVSTQGSDGRHSVSSSFTKFLPVRAPLTELLDNLKHRAMAIYFSKTDKELLDAMGP